MAQALQDRPSTVAGAGAANEQGDRWWLARRGVPCVIGAVILLVATGLRIVSIDQVPRFTDETDIIVHSLEIVRSGTRPLTDTEAYIGSGFNYTLAATFAIFGVGPVVPRYLVAAMGVLTVAAVFFLAAEVSALARRRPDRRPWDRPDIAAGLIGAAVFAVSPVHILVNSRIGWAHSVTPLVTTLAFAVLIRAVRREQPSLLPVAGFLAGFALQTHPSVVAILPGVLLWLLWKGRGLFRDIRAVLLAVAFGAIGCANLIAYNLLTGLDSVRSALSVSDAYDAERGGQITYLESLGVEALGLLRVLAGAIGTQRGDEVPVSPEMIAWAVMAFLAVVYAARRGVTIAALTIVPFLLILPVLNTKFDPMFNGRYLIPIVPLIVAAWALTAVGIYRRMANHRFAAPIIATTLLLVTLGLPVWSFAEFQHVTIAAGANHTFERLADRVREARGPGDVILLDNALGGERYASRRRGVGLVEYYLIMTADPPSTVVGDANELIEYLDTRTEQTLLVLLPRARRQIGARFDLTPVGAVPRQQDQNVRNAGVFRVEKRT